MPSTQYVGKAGHLALMGEFCHRGYNVAMPEIDKGDDIFVVNDATGAMWRVQAKTSVGRKTNTTKIYQFRVKTTQINTAQNPDLHFIFIMRDGTRWRFLVLAREVLRQFVRDEDMGTLNKEYRLFTVIKHGDNQFKCSDVDLTPSVGDWNTWPKLD